MSEYTRFLEAFRAAVQSAEFTQIQLAERMGVRQSYVSRVLTGHRRMGRRALGGALRVFPHLRPLVLAVLIGDQGTRGNGRDAA